MLFCCHLIKLEMKWLICFFLHIYVHLRIIYVIYMCNSFTNQLRLSVLLMLTQCCGHFPSHSTLPTSPNSHFRFHGCILHTHTRTHTHRQAAHRTRAEKTQGGTWHSSKETTMHCSAHPPALTLETPLFSMQQMKKKKRKA